MGKFSNTWSMIPAFLLAVVGAIFAEPAGKFMMWGLAIVYFIGLALVQSALQAIFQTAIFLYARDNQVPPGFQAEMLQHAMRQKS
jgi:fucose permease